MGTDPPGFVKMTLPPWLWGSSIDDYIRDARLEQRPHGGDVRLVGVPRVRKGHETPLVRSRALCDMHGLNDVGVLRALEVDGVGKPNTYEPADHRDAQHALHRLAEDGHSSVGVLGRLTSELSQRQLEVMAAAPDDVAAHVRVTTMWLGRIPASEGGMLFPDASAHLITRDPALLHRSALASVLLRLSVDSRMREADLSQAMEAHDAGELVFNSSGALATGMAVLDAYLAPLLGAMTPFLWGFPVTRGVGTVLFSFGRPITGTSGTASEPIQLLPSPSRSEPEPTPALDPDAVPLAIRWWARRLDKLLATVTNPAVFADEDERYQPINHLQAGLTIDQLFRRVGSIQRADRDRDVRRVLLFNTLDTLERLSSRKMTEMCTLSFADRTLTKVRGAMTGHEAQVLLPAAERAVRALRHVQEGFFLPKQLGASSIDVEREDGTLEVLDLETAAASYLRLLRNSTHGHGTIHQDRRALTNTLLISHSGEIHHDLPLLGYLYLLELMCSPTMLRRTLHADVAREARD